MTILATPTRARAPNATPPNIAAFPFQPELPALGPLAILFSFLFSAGSIARPIISFLL